MEGFKIGELARNAGVNIQTVRYYERRGLLPPPTRTASNYRIYSEEDFQRVKFIKGAQALGFSLKEIQELLALRVKDQATCGEVFQKALRKVQEIDEKIAALQRIRSALTKLMAACQGHAPIRECPILEAMNHEEVEKWNL